MKTPSTFFQRCYDFQSFNVENKEEETRNDSHQGHAENLIN